MSWRRRPIRDLNNSEQFGSDTIRRQTGGAVEHLRVDVQRRVDLGMAHQCGHHLAGDTFSCAHDEYVRRNVSLEIFGNPSPLAATTMCFRTLFDEIDLPDHVAKTSASGSTGVTRRCHVSMSCVAATASGTGRSPASVLGVPKIPS